jgi:hypothetical protein
VLRDWAQGFAWCADITCFLLNLFLFVLFLCEWMLTAETDRSIAVPVQAKTATQAVGAIKSGDKVFIHAVAAAPQQLIKAMVGRASELRGSFMLAVLRAATALTLGNQVWSCTTFIPKEPPTTTIIRSRS